MTQMGYLPGDASEGPHCRIERPATFWEFPFACVEIQPELLEADLRLPGRGNYHRLRSRAC